MHVGMKAEVISARQVARMLGVNVKTIYEAVRVGEIPHRRLGAKKIIFELHAVLAWLRQDCVVTSSKDNDER